MASTLNPYLSFRDDARAAMEFYKDALGGELTISTFGEYGDSSAPEANLVMHAQLTTPDGFTLMGSDTPPGMDYSGGGGFSISLSGDDEGDLRGYYDKLAEGGTVMMPLEKQMWGDVFGMLTDKFGVNWMVNIAGETQG
jgi:PhnB protein